MYFIFYVTFLCVLLQKVLGPCRRLAVIQIFVLSVFLLFPFFISVFPSFIISESVRTLLTFFLYIYLSIHPSKYPSIFVRLCVWPVDIPVCILIYLCRSVCLSTFISVVRRSVCASVSALTELLRHYSSVNGRRVTAVLNVIWFWLVDSAEPLDTMCSGRSLHVLFLRLSTARSDQNRVYCRNSGNKLMQIIADTSALRCVVREFEYSVK